MPIEHVSDTARWVAFYRAMETERRGRAVPRSVRTRDSPVPRASGLSKEMPRGRATAWAMITRTGGVRRDHPRCRQAAQH